MAYRKRRSFKKSYRRSFKKRGKRRARNQYIKVSRGGIRL